MESEIYSRGGEEAFVCVCFCCEEGERECGGGGGGVPGALGGERERVGAHDNTVARRTADTARGLWRDAKFT